MKLIFHPDADAELTEAARYYESCRQGLGSDYITEVERALDQILTNPGGFPEDRQKSTAEAAMAVPL